MPRLLALFVAVVALAACSSGKVASRPVSSAADLLKFLDAHRVGCDGYEAATAAQREKFVKEQGYCQIQGESAELFIFSTVGDLQSWVKGGVEAACSSGFPAAVFVRGPNWIIQPETTAVTQIIQARAGGSAEVHNCSP